MSDQPAVTPRLLYVSPNRFIFGLLPAIGLLWISDRFRWFEFNQHKGWAVLIGATLACVAAVGLLVWFLASLLFRWQIQFGIRTLLLLVVACSAAGGWFSSAIQNARRQAATVAWLEGVDECDPNDPLARPTVYCRCVSDWTDEIPEKGQRELPVPKWLQDLFGPAFFTDVVEVSLYDTWTNNDGLECLRGLAHLRRLDLGGTHVTDSLMGTIKNLAELEDLDASRTKFTDAAADRIGHLTRLRSLNLYGTALTDAGLRYVTNLSNLESLDVACTAVTDAGLTSVEQLEQLESLSVSCTAITDEGLRHIGRLRHLTHLDLGSTSVTRIGLQRVVEQLPQLQYLEVNDTHIGPGGLECLKNLTRLESLYIDDGQVGEFTLSTLKSLPRLGFLSIHQEHDNPNPAASHRYQKLPNRRVVFWK